MRRIDYTRRDYELDRHSAQTRRNLNYAVAMGMWPFRAKDIVVYDDYDIDMNRFRIGAEFRIEGEMFPFRVIIDRDDMIMNPYDQMLSVANQFLQYYRFDIPTIPMYIEGVQTHPHISLGEN